MVDFDYNTGAFFKYLPTVWSQFYADASQLETVYESWLRAMDSNYAVLTQIDAAKDLTTLPSFTRYPVIRQELPNWKSLKAKHAHQTITFDWPAVTNGSFVVKLANQFISEDSVVYLDGLQVPSFLYSISYNPWFDVEVIDGTTLTFNQALLNKFVTGEPLGSAYGNTTNFLAQDWPAVDEIQRGSVLVMRELQSFTATSDGLTSTYTLTPTTAGTLEAFDATLTIQSIDATALSVITPITDGYSVAAKSIYGYGNGLLLEIYLSDGTVQFKQVSGTVPVLVTSTATIESIKLRIDFVVDPSRITVAADSITLRGQQFYAGARVRVTDPAGSQAFVVDKPTSHIQLTRSIDPDQAEIRFMGVDLLNSSVTETQLVLAQPAARGVVLSVRAPIHREHGHGYQSITLTSPTDTVQLTTPVSVDSDYPIQVFIDGLLLDADSDYTFTSTTITLTEIPPASVDQPGVVDVYFTTEDGEQHRHVFGEQFFAAQLGETTYTFDIGKPIDGDTFAVQLYRDNHLYTDFTVVNNQFLRFGQELDLTFGVLLYANAAVMSKAYEHDIPIRTDGVYAYSGQVSALTEIRDKVKNPTKTYTDFELDYVPQISTTLRHDDPLEFAWLVDVLVDERTAQKNWGQDIGYVRDTSDAYSRTVAALYTARYEPSTVYSIENYGAIILGAPFTSRESYSLGVSGAEIALRPTNTKEADTTVTLLPGLATRIKASPEIMPKFWALNDLVHVYDRSRLLDVPYLAHFAEEVSESYQFAKRLDATEPAIISGVATGFNEQYGQLTDASADFTHAEVRPGDLICYNILSAVSYENQIGVAYLNDNTGYEVVSSATYNVPDGTYSKGSITVTLPLEPVNLVTELEVADELGQTWILTADTFGTLVSTFKDASAPATLNINSPDGSLWEVTVDSSTGNISTTDSGTASDVITPIVPGVSPAQWALTCLDTGELVTTEIGALVPVAGTDSSEWGIYADSLGAPLLQVTGIGTSTTVLYAEGTNGGQWLIEVDPSGPSLVSTFVSATPSTAVGPVILNGTGGTFWRLQVSEEPSTLGDIVTIVADLVDASDLSRFTVGAFFSLSGLGSPWALASIEETYTISEVSASATELTITAPWIHTTVPATTTETVGITAFTLDEVNYLAIPPVIATNSYAVIDKIIDNNTIQFPFVLDEEAIFGYGEGVFGGGNFGGAILASSVSSYTIYSRRTRTLDNALFYDQALSDELALSTGESISALNTQLADLLKHHNIVVEYEWESPRTSNDTEDLIEFVDTVRPAETNAFIYTEAFKGTSELTDELDFSLDPDDTVDISVASGSAYGASFYVGSALISAVLPSNAFSFTSDPDAYTTGPTLESSVVYSTVLPTGLTPVSGGYYLVAPPAALQPSSLFARIYGEQSGLANQVLQVIDNEDTTYNWVINNGITPRITFGMRLLNRGLRIPYLGETNKQFTDPNELTYTEGDALTFELWLTPLGIPAGSVATVFEWGDFLLLIETDTPAESDDDPIITLTWQATTEAAGVTTGAELVIGTAYHIVVTYEHDGVDGYCKLYVDGLLAGESTPSITPSESTAVGISATDVFIGVDSTGSQPSNITITQPILSVGTLYELADVEDRYAETNLAAVGVKSDGTVLAPAGATFWLNFFTNDTYVLDYTGNGFTAQKFGGVTDADWRVSGHLTDTVYRQGDLHAVRNTGLVYYNGVLLSQSQLTSVSLDDPLVSTALENGTAVTGGVTYSLPATWVSAQATGWEITPSALPLTGSSIGVDTSSDV
jgi:hypothetical protein